MNTGAATGTAASGSAREILSELGPGSKSKKDKNYDLPGVRKVDALL